MQYDAIIRERKKVALQEGLDIARTELARRRRRLGTLTREQELVLENLMMLAVTKVSELVGNVQSSMEGMGQSDNSNARQQLEGL